MEAGGGEGAPEAAAQGCGRGRLAGRGPLDIYIYIYINIKYHRSKILDTPAPTPRFGRGPRPSPAKGAQTPRGVWLRVAPSRSESPGHSSEGPNRRWRVWWRGDDGNR